MLTFPFFLLSPVRWEDMDPRGAMGWAQAALGHWAGAMLSEVLVVLEFCLLLPSPEVPGEVSGVLGGVLGG